MGIGGNKDHFLTRNEVYLWREPQIWYKALESCMSDMVNS